MSKKAKPRISMVKKTHQKDINATNDEDFFWYNNHQDEQEAIQVVLGSDKQDYEKNHWYRYG